MGLALNRKWHDDAGAEKEEVTFIDVETWGKQAEVACQYLKKGSRLLVEGRLKLNTWDDKQTNQPRSQVVVVLESMTFLDSGTKNAPQAKPSANAAQGARP
jgi:single-strand DNA-binding protein